MGKTKIRRLKVQYSVLMAEKQTIDECIKFLIKNGERDAADKLWQLHTDRFIRTQDCMDQLVGSEYGQSLRAIGA